MEAQINIVGITWRLSQILNASLTGITETARRGSERKQAVALGQNAALASLFSSQND
jgi:hypothetical protein